MVVTTLHFIYTLPVPDLLDGIPPNNSPHTISYHAGRFLRERARERGWDFHLHALDSDADVTFAPDDVVVGHTWYPDGLMNRALSSPARVKLVLQPYQSFMVAPSETAWIRALFARADHLCLITGQTWWDAMPDTPYADWQAKATRVDMAVEAAHHPFLKRRYNPRGKRAFLAIGTDKPYKGLDMVAALAAAHGAKLGYLGDADWTRFQHVPRLTHYGGRELLPSFIQQLCDTYDGFLSLARGDANPTTLLETACWGLTGFCNEGSGYYANRPFLPLKTNDMAFNLEQIEAFQWTDESALRARAVRLRQVMETEYTWDKFCSTVWGALQSWL